MKTKTEKTGNSRVKLVVTVEPKELVPHFKAAYDELAADVKLPGFRPGKAPRKMVEDSVGVARLLSAGLDTAVQSYYGQGLVAEDLSPVSYPNIAINTYPTFGLTEDEIASDFEFEAEVDVFPEVKLKDYSKVKVEVKEPRKIGKEEIEKFLTHLQKQKATFQDVDRPAQKDDFVEIDFEGSQKGVKLDAMTSKNHPLVLGEGTLIPGFEDEVVGMKKGEEKTFTIKFPKDYHAKEFAGKDAEFKVKLNQLKEIKLPELNDDFAEKFGYKKIEELKEQVEKSLKDEVEHEHKHEVEAAVVEKLLPLLEVDIPESLIENETSRMVEEIKERLTSQGLSFEKYLESLKKDQAAFIKEVRPQAEKNVKTGLLLGVIIKEQKIDEKAEDAGRKALDFLVVQVTKK